MNSHERIDRLLTRKQAAEILCIQPQTLAKWASKNGPERGLPFIKIGSSTRYRREDILSFIENGKNTKRKANKPKPPEITSELVAARQALNLAGQKGLTPRQLHRDRRSLFPTSDLAEKAFNQLFQLNIVEKIVITKATGRQKTAWRLIEKQNKPDY